MIRPIIPVPPFTMPQISLNIVTYICAALVLLCSAAAAWLTGMYAAHRFGNGTKKPAAIFALIIGASVSALLCFYGLSADAVFFLILIFASYSDIRTRECYDCLHLMIVIAALIGTDVSDLPGMLLSGITAGIAMLIPALLGTRSLGGADIKLSAACAFLLGLRRGMAGLVIGLLFAVVINAVHGRKKNTAGFPLIPYLSVGFAAVYFM